MSTKVQLTGGAFQDSEGNLLANGYLEFKLSQDGSVSGVGSICSGITIRIQLDSAGNVASSTSTPSAADQYIWGNDNILPANTFYQVTGYTAAGQPAWGPNNQQVTGSSPFNTGTWIPNQVFSWTPPTVNPELEVNGTPNVVQSELDLVDSASVTWTDNGDGSVSATASGGGSFPGAGEGLMFSGETVAPPVITATNFTVQSTANRVGVCLLNVLASITIRKILANFSVSGGIPSTWGSVAIYSYDGLTKVLDAGTVAFDFSGGVTGAYAVTLGSPVVLAPGAYWFAWASNMTYTAQVAVGHLINAAVGNMLNQSSRTYVGTAANAMTTVLPATLGVITPVNTLDIPSIAFVS